MWHANAAHLRHRELRLVVRHRQCVWPCRLDEGPKVLTHWPARRHLQPRDACLAKHGIQLVCETHQIRLHVFKLQDERWVRFARCQRLEHACTQLMH